MQPARPAIHSDPRTAIAEAIGAHGAWKTRLRTAVVKGDTTIDPVQLADGHICRFGVWLDGFVASNPNDRTARRIGDLHQQFHRCAATVALFIREGRTEEAMRDIETGRFQRIGNSLVARMMEWRSEI